MECGKDDKVEVQVAVGYDEKTNLVCIDFATHVKSIKMGYSAAMEMSRALAAQAKSVKIEY